MLTKPTNEKFKMQMQIYTRKVTDKNKNRVRQNKVRNQVLCSDSEMMIINTTKNNKDKHNPQNVAYSLHIDAIAIVFSKRFEALITVLQLKGSSKIVKSYKALNQM